MGWIRDPGSKQNFSRIRSYGSNSPRIPDLGSGSASLIASERIKFLVSYGCFVMSYPKPLVKSGVSYSTICKCSTRYKLIPYMHVTRYLWWVDVVMVPVPVSCSKNQLCILCSSYLKAVFHIRDLFVDSYKIISDPVSRRPQKNFRKTASKYFSSSPSRCMWASSSRTETTWPLSSCRLCPGTVPQGLILWILLYFQAFPSFFHPSSRMAAVPYLFFLYFYLFSDT